ncbi:hypothetical protein N825_13895 [Skermanella stibiiresistens SB22]|uniref:D-isomer specific 2-hydroxyacid dehydrogenase NAD-binding domain-containing protein n=1 Tax=Skermanella stibiiresistens SB22 TaxID=1385369 RepID=W9H0C5_9PROT|nr:D-2-hydroxyacid dehydrogenase [Skermanella stibiiresistens]EWY38296.1 hypothetical protein N825_13895 [Skermanella stibiiresistens SB22]
MTRAAWLEGGARLYVENARGRDPAYLIGETAVRDALGPEVEVTVRFDDQRDLEALRRATLFMGGKIDTALLSANAPNLRLVHCTSAGVEPYLPLDWLPAGAVLTNSSGVHAAKVGEFGLMALLMLNDRIPLFATNQRAHVWHRHLNGPIAGKRVLIHGVGALGGAVAEKARLLGIEVLGVRRGGGSHPHVDHMVTPERLGEVLPKADFLVVTCPLTDRTRGVIGAAELAALKPGAGVVNLSRAAVMDYDALADALERGHVSGAILDVFEREPLPASARWWDVPNLMVVPHVSADDPTSYIDRCLAILADNLRRAAEGLPLRNVVREDRGY